MPTAARPLKTKPIKTAEALAALEILTLIGAAKRPMLQKLMGERLGRKVSDNSFEAALRALGPRIARVSGVGGGIFLI